MTENLERKTELRDYLLGRLKTEPELTPIEEELMTSDDYFQELLIEEEELIQDYVDDYLDSMEKDCFEKFFLNSSERYEKVKFAKSLRNFISEQKKSEEVIKETVPQESALFWQWLFAKPALAGLGGVAVIVISLLVWNNYFRSSENSEVIVSLNKAYQKERPFESRVAGLDYAPTNNLRGNEKAKVDTTSFDLAKSLALKAVSDNPTAENLHALGKVYLLERELDKAIEQLEKATKLAPKNANIASDLGVALLEKSKLVSKNEDGKRVEFSAKALEEFEKALQIKPDLAEAIFNKAVCLQQNSMPRQAIEAWQEYLKIDSTSKWADEAKRNIELLNELKKSQSKKAEEVWQDFMSAFRNQDDTESWHILSRNREMISGKLIPQQLAFFISKSEGDEKKEYLSALKYAGELEKKHSGDAFFAEVAKFYSSASAEKLQILREAQESVKNGYKFAEDNKHLDSADEFTKAKKRFAEVGDVWEEKLAEYWIAYNEHQLKNISGSGEKLNNLATFCESKNYHWLSSLVFSRLSINSGVRGKISESIKYNYKSLELAKKTSDLYQQQRIHTQLAGRYRQLRQYRESLKNVQKSFEFLNIPEISIRQKSRTFDTAVEIAIEKKFYTMAVNLIKESKALNETEIKDQTYAHSVEIQLADIYNTQKNYEKAIDSIQKSVAITEQMVDEKHRLTFNAISLLRYADTERFKGNCEQAVNYYNQSIEIYHKIFSPARYYEAKKNRLFCYLGQKDDETIEKEIADVIKLFESNRTKILEEQNRNTFADDEQNIYDLAVAFNFSKRNYEKAFNYSETSRSRSLLELQEKGAKLSTENNKNQIIFDEKATSNPLDLATIRSQISPQVQLIEYAVLSNKVVIWLITKDKFETYSFEIESNELENKVADFLDSIKNKQSETQARLSRELYQVLFSEVEKDLDKNKEIFVIPDKILFHLPFNALISTNTNNYLASDYKIALSPSANVFLHCAENAKKRNLSEPEKLLSVGNPAFDQNEFPNLSQPLSAEKEARKIEKLYPKPTTTLIGKEATKEALKINISQATVFHFAGHYVISEESPLLSSFLVAGEGENSKLTNFELFEQSLEKSKLIVLSACETGVEGYYKGEGMIGAGRTFLASGVPLVVASSWKVDFDATGELMLKFHQYRKNDGLDSVSALQKAQIEMINNQDKDFSQPFYWAGFSVIGGYAEF